ncbi:MAG: hypothetical protein KJ597_01730, partial [Nanoarchaeota archaeon]|nr:hypothetical protein [Nanoarchaeota archaeon]
MDRKKVAKNKYSKKISKKGSVDKHKVWLIAGIAIAVLFIGILLVVVSNPSERAIAGQATAYSYDLQFQPDVVNVNEEFNIRLGISERLFNEIEDNGAAMIAEVEEEIDWYRAESTSWVSPNVDQFNIKTIELFIRIRPEAYNTPQDIELSMEVDATTFEKNGNTYFLFESEETYSLPKTTDSIRIEIGRISYEYFYDNWAGLAATPDPRSVTKAKDDPYVFEDQVITVYTPTPDNELICDNKIDDDGDGFVDCADADCDGQAGNSEGDLCEYAKELTCNDGFDNDADLSTSVTKTDISKDLPSVGGKTSTKSGSTMPSIGSGIPTTVGSGDTKTGDTTSTLNDFSKDLPSTGG